VLRLFYAIPWYAGFHPVIARIVADLWRAWRDTPADLWRASWRAIADLWRIAADLSTLADLWRIARIVADLWRIARIVADLWRAWRGIPADLWPNAKRAPCC
jgi:hypothetical protein